MANYYKLRNQFEGPLVAEKVSYQNNSFGSNNKYEGANSITPAHSRRKRGTSTSCRVQRRQAQLNRTKKSRRFSNENVQHENNSK